MDGWTKLRALVVRAGGLLRKVRRAPPAREQVGGPLDEIDDEFHGAYEAARDERADDVPVWVVLADELVCLQGGRRTSYRITPRSYQLIKKVSHTPLALFAGAYGDAGRRGMEDTLGRRDKLLAWVRNASSQLPLERALDADTRSELTHVLEVCARVLREQPRTTRAQADALAQELGPVLLRLITRATELQLAALDAAVEQALRGLASHERAQLQVVVTGNHQARVRSLPMQYFRLRLGEPEEREARVAYAEGVSSEAEALAFVGTRRLDRALARAFFDDPQRMQRDLLGDAARELLIAHPPSRID